jgi:hypothetical protein
MQRGAKQEAGSTANAEANMQKQKAEAHDGEVLQLSNRQRLDVFEQPRPNLERAQRMLLMEAKESLYSP